MHKNVRVMASNLACDEPWKGEARGEEPAVAAADVALRSLRS